MEVISWQTIMQKTQKIVTHQQIAQTLRMNTRMHIQILTQTLILILIQMHQMKQMRQMIQRIRQRTAQIINQMHLTATAIRDNKSCWQYNLLN